MRGRRPFHSVPGNVFTFEAKKMIVAQFVKAVHVRRDYEINIEFDVQQSQLVMMQALFLLLTFAADIHIFKR